MKTTIATLLIIASFGVTSAAADDGPGGRGFVALLGAIAEAAHRSGGVPDAERHGYYGADRHHAGPAYGHRDERAYVVDLSGSWVMRNGTANRFQRTHEGYYVVPVGRGRGVHYLEIGHNLYQDASSSGTYEVIDANYMIWRSNDQRNLMIELFR